MNQLSLFKSHRFFTYFLLGLIIGCVLGLSFKFFYNPQSNPPRLSFIQFVFPSFSSMLPNTTLVLLTVAGALGGALYAMKNKELVPPHKTENGVYDPGWLGDCFFGVAGAYVISLIVPGEFPSNKALDVQLTTQILATGIIGGYGGRSIIDRALDNIISQQEELEKKVKGHSHNIEQVRQQAQGNSQNIEQVRQQAQGNSQNIEQVRQQAQSNAKSLALLERYFDEDLDPTEPELEEIKKLMEHISHSERMFIFVEAKKVREINTREEHKNSSMIERTIPIFEALIKVDTDERFLHRYYAQLGYALKEKPDWVQAEAMLSKAIEIRDKSPDKEESFWFYEFNRAVCRIKLDKNSKEIVRDLEKSQAGVTKQPQYLSKLDKDTRGVITNWLMQNNALPTAFELLREFDKTSDPSDSNGFHADADVGQKSL